MSEIVNIRIASIDSKNRQVFITRAKGEKAETWGRYYVNLPKSMQYEIRMFAFRIDRGSTNRQVAGNHLSNR